MGLDRLGDEGRDGCPRPPQFIVVVRGRRRRVHAGTRHECSRVGSAQFAGVGILTLVPDHVTDRQTAVVVAIDRLAVTLTPFKGIKHPSPS